MKLKSLIRRLPRMRLVSAILVILPALLVAAWPTLCTAASLAGRVPANPLIYIGWAGAPRQWNGYQKSRFQTFLRHSRMSELFTRDLPEVIQYLEPAHPAAARQIAQTLVASNLFFTHPFALYISHFNLAFHAAVQPPLGLQVELVMNAGKNRAAALNFFKRIASELNHTGSNPPPPALRLTAGHAGNLVYIANGLTPKMASLLGIGTSVTLPRSFISSRAYQNSLAQTQTHPAFLAYMDVHAIVQLFNRALVAEASSGTGGKRIVRALEKSLGINGYTTFAMTAGIDGRQFMQSLYLGETNAHTASHAQADLGQMLRLVPQSCDNMAVSRLDLKAVTDFIFKAIKLSGRSGEISHAMAMVRAATGLNVRHDFINAFGPDWLVYQSPYLPLVGNNGLMLVNRLRHPRRMAQSLVTLTPVLMVGANAAYRKSHPNGPPLRLLHTQVGNAIIYYLQTPTFMPAWCVTGNEFLFSPFPRTIQLTLEHKPGRDSILNSAKFKKVMSRLGADNGMECVGYADDPAMAPAGYMEIAMLEKLIPLFTGIHLHPPLTAVFPKLADLENILTPSGFVTWHDASGIHSRAISAFPGSELFTPQSVSSVNLEMVAPMAAAIAVPAIARARSEAVEVTVASNERRIIQDCTEYSVSHQSCLPQSAAEILKLDNNPARWIYPHSATQPLAKSLVKTLSLASLNHRLKSHSDLIYVGDGVDDTKLADPSAFILIYSPTSSHGANRVVGFADGHVEPLTAPTFNRLVTRNNRIRQRLNLPLIHLRQTAAQ